MAINFDYKKNGQIPLYLFFAAFELDVSFLRHPIHKIQVRLSQLEHKDDVSEN